MKMEMNHKGKPVLQSFDRSYLYTNGTVYCQGCCEEGTPEIEPYIDLDEKDLHCSNCGHRIGTVSIHLNIPATV